MALHAAQHEGAPRLRGQGGDDRFQPAQRVACIEHAVGVDAPLQPVEIGHIVERDDHLASLLVDQHVVGGTGQEGEAVADRAPVGAGEGPREYLGDQIVQVLRVADDPAQAMAQQCLLRQDHRLEPFQFLIAIAQTRSPWVADPLRGRMKATNAGAVEPFNCFFVTPDGEGFVGPFVSLGRDIAVFRRRGL